MKRSNLIYLLFACFFSIFSIGQQTISGKIVASPEIALEKITLFNTNSKKTTFTDALGYFTIEASSYDIISISAIHINTLQHLVEPADFDKKILFIRITQKTNQLAEIEIKTSKIDAVSLGILQKPAKKYTVAERRLRTAENFHWYSPLLIPAGGMSLDGLLNAVSGRKKMLENNLKIERNERDLVKLDNFCKEEFYTENLKIPKEYIKGFQIYTLDNHELKLALKANNKTLTHFLLAQLAEKYRNIAEIKP